MYVGIRRYSTGTTDKKFEYNCNTPTVPCMGTMHTFEAIVPLVNRKNCWIFLKIARQWCTVQLGSLMTFLKVTNVMDLYNLKPQYSMCMQ